VKLRVGEANRLPTGNSRENVLTVKLGYDDLDDWLFAQRGSVIDITGQFFEDSIGADQDYQQITLYGRQHWLMHKDFTLISDFTLATALRSTPPEYAYFSMGGFEQLAGYALNEISGRQALVVRWGGLWGPLTSLRLGTIEARWLGLLHMGNAWPRYEDFKVTDLHYGGLTALVWNTGLGAIALGMGYTDGGSLHYYLSLGRLFN
jgi:outer membrane translocation and assembly module TamA